MSATERTHRHRHRLREKRAEQRRITETYSGGRPPLSQKERCRLAREMSWLIKHGVIDQGGPKTRL
jgi:hypothetical protein